MHTFLPGYCFKQQFWPIKPGDIPSASQYE
ncbi:hypothetical protein YpMG051020_4470 [Yersinia pestis biovar Orientalis str. MG05-1020]|nr:hypothetical protein YpMG051020_4470 [Yersinia pestis biovar Orientalis str. MG05-1020]